jgi:hypothetical protein
MQRRRQYRPIMKFYLESAAYEFFCTGSNAHVKSVISFSGYLKDRFAVYSDFKSKTEMINISNDGKTPVYN